MLEAERFSLLQILSQLSRMLESGKVKILIPQEYQISVERKRVMRAFLSYCIRALKILNDYTGQLVLDRQEFGIETTAVARPSLGKFFVYAKNRGFADILRSIAHELVHIRQHEKDPDRYRNVLNVHFSSEYEDEANKIAGELINAFTEVVGYDIVYEGKNAYRAKTVGTRRNLG